MKNSTSSGMNIKDFREIQFANSGAYFTGAHLSVLLCEAVLTELTLAAPALVSYDLNT
jgi:hypothetical protein